jgi:TM2 domain-containing membrane protein YozV
MYGQCIEEIAKVTILVSSIWLFLLMAVVGFLWWKFQKQIWSEETEEGIENPAYSGDCMEER